MRLLLVEDDIPLRMALALELEQEGCETTVVADGAEALDLLGREPKPELLILDWDLLELSGLDVCRSIRREGLVLPVLMLTGHHRVADRVVALDAGADDYLVKPFSIEELMARVRALWRRAQRGGLPIESNGHPLDALTPRELEVLRELAKGCSNAEIAASLYLSLETIKTHLKSLMLKLHAKDRTHAVLIALRRGLIPLTTAN